MEVARQICDFDAIVKKDKHKIGFGGDFPLRIGTGEAYPSILSTQALEEEMSTLILCFHSKRSRFDIIGEAQKRASREYSHKVNLEDYWANFSDEYEVIKKKFSLLLVDVVHLCNVRAVPDQLDNDGNLIQDHAYEN